MTDIKDGAVLTCVHVRGNVAVFVLHWHAPSRKLHHLTTLILVEVMQLGLLYHLQNRKFCNAMTLYKAHNINFIKSVNFKIPYYYILWG